jgi:hypothetical protein
MNRPHGTWATPLDNIKLRISAASSAPRLRVPAWRIVDVLQFSPAEDQLDALWITAVAMAEAVGMNPHDMVARAKRIIPEAEGPFTEHLQSARDYAKGELKK